MTYFKLIASLALAATLSACNASQDSAQVTTSAPSLFDAPLETNFHSDAAEYFTIANGELTTLPDGGRFKMRTRESYSDFTLSVDFFVEAETNSGIYIRCENPEDINPGTCYEINISEVGRDGGNSTGSIFRLTDNIVDVPTAGKWNTLTIDAKGDHMVVKVNGQTTVDIHDDKLAAGIMAIQYAEGGKLLKMRNFNITPL